MIHNLTAIYRKSNPNISDKMSYRDLPRNSKFGSQDLIYTSSSICFYGYEERFQLTLLNRSTKRTENSIQKVLLGNDNLYWKKNNFPPESTKDKLCVATFRIYCTKQN